MPFKSQAQRRFMYSQHPEIAKRFSKHTPKGAKLPEHVKKSGLLDTVKGYLARVGRPVAGAAERIGISGPSRYINNAGSAEMGTLAGRLGVNTTDPVAMEAFRSKAMTSPDIASKVNTAQQGRAALVGGIAAAPVAGAALAATPWLANKTMGPTDLSELEDTKLAAAPIGTPFTDGFFKYCLDNRLTGEQVATLLEKGAGAKCRVGDECRGLLERMV